MIEFIQLKASINLINKVRNSASSIDVLFTCLEVIVDCYLLFDS